MTILVLVRNFVPAHEQVASGGWNVAAVAKGEYDLEGKVVGTVAVGRIGERVLRRLRAFDCKELLYFDYQPLKPETEKEIGCRRVEKLEVRNLFRIMFPEQAENSNSQDMPQLRRQYFD